MGEIPDKFHPIFSCFVQYLLLGVYVYAPLPPPSLNQLPTFFSHCPSMPLFSYFIDVQCALPPLFNSLPTAPLPSPVALCSLLVICFAEVFQILCTHIYCQSLPNFKHPNISPNLPYFKPENILSKSPIILSKYSAEISHIFITLIFH